MILSVAGLAALGVWDEARESEAALDDFATEQTALARVAAAGLAARVDALRDGQASPPEGLVPGSARIESDSSVVLVLPPGGTRFERGDGGLVSSTLLRHELAAGRAWVRLTRAQAASVGLPERTAMAGLAHARTAHGVYGVVVATSARRERDRESRARTRLVLGVVLAAGLVGAFGGIALRSRRKEVELGQALAAENVAHLRDEHLAQTGRAAAMLTFAAGVAHEISTPLGAIALRAEQLQPHVNDQRSARALAVIQEQTERIKQVVRDFLRLARGGGPVRERVSPADIIKGATELVAHRFAAAGVVLESDTPADVSVVAGDSRLLEQAVVNLLLNACDACRPGGHVTVGATTVDGAVVLEVVDDGTGIDPSYATRVLEPFFTTKAPGEGSGLGLAIAAEIAKMHRGRLSLAARRPRGTVATIRLPADGGSRELG